MITRSASRWFGRSLVWGFSSAIVLFFTATTAAAQSTTEAPGIEQRLSKLEAGQQQMQQSLQRLEARLDQLATKASEFSRVVVRLRTHDGTPVSGFKATLHTGSAQVRKARATGTSGRGGVAIDRFMPYGEYALSLKAPHGWSASIRDLLVEVGQPLELDVVAPDPANRGHLVLRSRLRSESFSFLPFGEIREARGGRAYSVEYTPEPDGVDRRAKSFPRLGNGIRRIAVRVAIGATYKIAQPNGDDLQWHWRLTSANGSRSEELWLTPDGATMARGFESTSVKPAEGGMYYIDLDEDALVNYLTVDELERPSDSLRVEVPAGEIQIRVLGVLGEVSPAVKQSLRIDSQEVPSVWLNVNLQSDSRWIDRLFERAGWNRAERYGEILATTAPVERGKEQTVNLASP